MQRPSGITLTAGVMAVLTLIGVVAAFTMKLPDIPTSSQMSAQSMSSIVRGGAIGGAIFGAVVSAVFIYLYWVGYSWMRWVVMVYSAFCIVGLVRVASLFALNPLSGISSIASALLAAFLLYYLNTEPVKAWFNGPKSAPTA